MADNKNEKKEETKAQTTVSTQTVQEVAEALIPSVVAAVQAGQQRAQVKASAKPKCLECGQPNMACQGKHREADVSVSGPYARWFQGVQINGVVYKSDHPGHRITVPEDANVEYAIEQFRASEERFATGRTFDHHSGYISQNGPNNFKPNHGPKY